MNDVHPESWPVLPVEAWRPTRDTFHLWTQIVGKVRLALAPPSNHWWHVTLYVNARGLTTSLMPAGTRGVELTFDLRRHQLDIVTTDGREVHVGLYPRSVADFYAETRGRLREVGVDVSIVGRPVEVEVAIPFAEDEEHASYDAEWTTQFWRSLIDADRVMTAFRTGFNGKSSPVHFFWGAFDLATTRFSGRTAPRHRGGIPNCPEWVMHDAYSHEVSSCGYWPGGADEGVFYSYAYPEPAGFRDVPLGVPAATYDTTLGEFVLPYAAVRAAPDPDALLREFLERTYDAAADLAMWDRDALDRRPSSGVRAREG
jgi:hypothetical protein